MLVHAQTTSPHEEEDAQLLPIWHWCWCHCWISVRPLQIRDPFAPWHLGWAWLCWRVRHWHQEGLVLQNWLLLPQAMDLSITPRITHISAPVGIISASVCVYVSARFDRKCREVWTVLVAFKKCPFQKIFFSSSLTCKHTETQPSLAFSYHLPVTHTHTHTHTHTGTL